MFSLPNRYAVAAEPQGAVWYRVHSAWYFVGVDPFVFESLFWPDLIPVIWRKKKDQPK